MEINLNKVVSLSYTLEVDGDVIETVSAQKPMMFIFGTGYLLPKFEEYIAGKKVGDTFEFTLTEDEGYGKVNPDAIVELPKKLFEVEGKIEDGLLTVGNVLPMMDSEGNRLNGAIDEVKDEEWMKNCKVWMYRGAWAEWDIDYIEMAVPISPEELRQKRNSILKHQSQMENAPFLGNDERLFWPRAEDRNKATAELYSKLGLASYEAIEAFVEYHPIR